MHLRLESQVSFFFSIIFFALLTTFLRLDYMYVNYDGTATNTHHQYQHLTNRGLETPLRLESQVSSFYYYDYYFTNDFLHSMYVNCEDQHLDGQGVLETHLRLESQVNCFFSFFFSVLLMIFYNLHYMYTKCESDNECTRPPIPTPG
jgi:hypothetical protein